VGKCDKTKTNLIRSAISEGFKTSYPVKKIWKGNKNCLTYSIMRQQLK